MTNLNFLRTLKHLAKHSSAPDSVIAKRPANDLNDTIVTVANPTARYKVGWTFKELEIKVWAVADGKIYGHNAEHGECWAEVASIITAQPAPAKPAPAPKKEAPRPTVRPTVATVDQVLADLTPPAPAGATEVTPENLKAERIRLAGDMYDCDRGAFPGSAEWYRERDAMTALSDFDRRHPEVLAEIRRDQSIKIGSGLIDL